MRRLQNRADQQPAGAAPLSIPGRTVSVVIACFDARRMSLLTRAIQSVRDQDYPNELTVVVDYSDDLYGEVQRTAPSLRNSAARAV